MNMWVIWVRLVSEKHGRIFDRWRKWGIFRRFPASPRGERAARQCLANVSRKYTHNEYRLVEPNGTEPENEK